MKKLSVILFMALAIFVMSGNVAAKDYCFCMLLIMTLFQLNALPNFQNVSKAADGSRPVIGSSRIQTGGLCISAATTMIFCRIP